MEEKLDNAAQDAEKKDNGGEKTLTGETPAPRKSGFSLSELTIAAVIFSLIMYFFSTLFIHTKYGPPPVPYNKKVMDDNK